MRSSHDDWPGLRTAADEAYARFTASRAELLRAVADLDEDGSWRVDGAASLASWLAARWEIAPATARELVRDARALRARPALDAALGAAEISVDQGQALTTLCDEDTDDDEVWLEALPFWSLGELQREARKKTAKELERRDGGAYLRMCHTPDERFVRGEFQLHPEDGAAVLAAVEERIPKETALRDWDRASARALVELTTGTDAPRATVLLSVREEALAGASGSDAVAQVGSDALVGAETAQRLSCDARIQALYKDQAGMVTGIGRTARSAPPWLRRALYERDGGMCTFPGCDRNRYLECHHIVFWGDGGPTELSNLQLTCWTHHTLLHEGGWSLRGEPGPDAIWIRPDGRPHEPRVRVTLDTC